MIEFGKKRPETANQNEEFILRDAEGEEIPQEMQTAMKMAGMGERPMPVPTLVPPPAPPISPLIPPSKKSTGDVEQSNVSLTTREIIEKLKQKQKYEEVLLPSRNMLYTQYGLGIDKPIHIKPMTIEEEKILSTPRMIRSGQALNKIYEACILEDIPITKILAPDRIFLLFFIRGISYGSQYEVEIKCPKCEQAFNEEINLDTLNVEYAPDNFTGEYHTQLPASELNVWYRISNGEDENLLTKTREMMAKNFSSMALDNGVIRKTILLVNRIESISNKTEIEKIVNELGVKDSGYLRNKINDPEFGVNTEIFMTCPSCYNEWTLDLPIDAGFFFPKTKKVS